MVKNQRWQIHPIFTGMIKLLHLLEWKVKTPAFSKGPILVDGHELFKVLEIVPNYETAVENAEFFKKKYKNDYIHMPPKDQFFGNLGPDAEDEYWYLLMLGTKSSAKPMWWENEGYIKFRLNGY